jgi:ankyrin repeat protein
MILSVLLQLLSSKYVPISIDIIIILINLAHIQRVKATFFLEEIKSKTLLHFACAYGSTILVKTLLRVGIDPNIPDSKGTTALHFAITGKYNDEEIVKRNVLTLKNVDSSLQIIKALIKYGARADLKDNKGRTPLYYATIHAQDIIVRYLIEECKSKINIADNDLKFPLHGVRLRSTAKLLFENGAAITLNLKDKWGQTPLHLAVNKNNKTLVQWLIEHGAYIDAKDKRGRTPLYIAVMNYNIEIIQLLLSRGARLDEKTCYGETPRMLAFSCLERHDQKKVMAFHRQCLNKVKQRFQVSYDISHVVLEDWLKLTPGVRYWIRYVDSTRGLVLNNQKISVYIPAEIVMIIDGKLGVLHGINQTDWENIKNNFFQIPGKPIPLNGNNKLSNHYSFQL